MKNNNWWLPTSGVCLVGTVIFYSGCGPEQAQLGAASNENRRRSLGLQTGNDDQEERHVVILRQDTTPPGLRRIPKGDAGGREVRRRRKAEQLREVRPSIVSDIELVAQRAGVVPDEIFTSVVSGFAGLMTAEQVERLQDDPNVDLVVPDENRFVPQAEAAVSVFPCSTLPAYYVERGISFAGGPVESSVSDAYIWVVDSGIDDHPDLNVLTQFSFGDQGDSSGHGTMVAGAAAAKYNQMATTGVAAGAPVVPINVFSNGLLGPTVLFSNLIAALDHVGQWNVEGDAVSIANFAFDFDGCADQSTGPVKILKDAILELTFDGTWVVTGAGNSELSDETMCGISDRGYPACINGFHMLTVSDVSLSASGVPGCGPHGWGNSVDYVVESDGDTLYKDGMCADGGGTSMGTGILAGIVLGRGVGATVPAFGEVDCCGGDYQNAASSSLAAMLFDVEIELDALYFGNVRDADGGEDLYGNFRYRSLTADSRTLNSTTRAMWSRSEATAASSTGFANGVRNVGAVQTIATSITYFDLLRSSFLVDGDVQDDEGWWASRDFVCTNCNANSNTARRFTFNSLPAAVASIQSLVMTLPVSKQLISLQPTVDYVAMTFAENGRTSDGYVTSRWLIRVTPHF